MKCPACGAELVADAKFCTYCGVAVASLPDGIDFPAAEKPKAQHVDAGPSSVAPLRLCSNCGEQLNTGESFCTNCGTRWEGTAQQMTPSPASRPVTPASADPIPAKAARFCTNCGNKLAPDEIFCSSCGTRAEAAPAGVGVGGIAQPAAKAYSKPSYVPTGSAKSTGEVEYKGVWPRFVASLVDFALYLVFMVLMASRFGTTSAQASDGVNFSFNLQGWPAAVLYLVTFAYMIVMEGYLGGTVGKLLMGIRVVDISGGKPGPARALIRNALRVVDFLPFFYLLGILLVAFSKKKRRLGDRAAGTYVISSRSVIEMKARGEVAKPANTVVAVVAGVLILATILSGVIFAPQSDGVSPSKASQSAQQQPTPTPVPAKASTSGGGPFGISLPSIPSPFGGSDPVDVAGNWAGSMTITGAKIDGATGDEQKKLDQQFSSIKGTMITMQFNFDGKNKDSGNLTLSGSGSFGGAQKFEYKVSGDKVTFGGKADEGNFAFEGKVSKKGSGYEIDGTFKAEGPATGISNSKTLKLEGSWKATK